MITTPDDSVDGGFFTVTHPFHPLSGQRFRCLGRHRRWCDARVSFLDPQTALLRSIPLAWTDWAAVDPYVVVAAGRAVLRLSDLQALARLVRTLRPTPVAPPVHTERGAPTDGSKEG